MPSRLTPIERAFVVIEYARTENGREVARRFENRFGRSINHSTPADVFERFRTTGSTEDQAHTGRPATASTVENKLVVRDSVLLDPTLSQRRRSLQLGIERSALRRILDAIDARCWHYQTTQHVSDGEKLSQCILISFFADDRLNRRAYSQWFLDRVADDPAFHTKVLWTDECIVRLQGSWNTHNMVWCGEAARQGAAEGNHDHRLVISDGVGRCVC